MIHNGRIFVISGVSSSRELAGRLAAGDVPLCRGIYHGGYLFLNDSESPEGRRRFAVMKAEKPPLPGRCEFDQVKTIDASGRSQDDILEDLGALRDAVPQSRVVVQIDGPGHVCPLCA